MGFEIFQDESKSASLEFALDLIGENAGYTVPFDRGGDRGLGLGDSQTVPHPHRSNGIATTARGKGPGVGRSDGRKNYAVVRRQLYWLARQFVPSQVLGAGADHASDFAGLDRD